MSWSWQEMRALPSETVTAHPLSDQLVQAGHIVAGRVSEHASGPSRAWRMARLLMPWLDFWKNVRWPRAGAPEHDAPGLWELRFETQFQAVCVGSEYCTGRLECPIHLT